MSKLKDKIKGIVFVRLEQGEEFPWGFNNTSYNYENTSNYVCNKCGRVWDKEKYPKEVKDIEGDYCKPKEHDFELNPKIYWSHDGLYYLENGDYLKIFDKDSLDKVVWEGEIKLKLVPVKFTFRRSIIFFTYLIYTILIWVDHWLTR